MVCLVIWIFFAAVSFAMYLLPMSHPLVRLPALRGLINRLSVGRTLVAAIDQIGTPNNRLSTERWISIAGQQSIDLFPVKEVAETDAEMAVLASIDVAGGHADAVELSPVRVSLTRRASV